ncbi:MAG: ATPase, T2SS/T4P/T4SS family [Promethearchaeota archaeon]
MLKSLLNIFEGLKLFKDFKSTQRRNNSLTDFLYSKPTYLLDPKPEIHELEIKGNINLLASYQTGNHKIYNVHIYERSFEEEKHYKVKAFFEIEPNKNYIEKVIFNIIQNFKIPELNRIIPLEHLIKFYENKSKELLKSKYSFSDPNFEKIGLIIALKKLHLDELYPLLIDDFVEEIFLDSPNDKIYLNHQKFGRCRTDIGLNMKEIERIKTLFRLYSGKRLDYMNPSIKLVLKNKYFYCRLAIDVGPIQIYEFAMDIRKLNRNIFTIQDLLKNETLDSRMAAFLYFNLLRKKNITITGETDTGKTTLINAFDLLTPKEFRKIYVENVTESLRQLDFGKHQLKYRVDSLDDQNLKNYSKSSIIKTLLHRTPDIIYLGEILTKEEAEAMFHCLAAGLKGFQTIHAENVDSLINRFLYHFKINKSCLSDLDLIVLMKKDSNDRHVVSVSEIDFNRNKDKIIHDLIFAYNPIQKKWNLEKSLYETKVITELCKYENLSKENFIATLDIYTNIFSVISRIEKLDKIELIDLFHKISYTSGKSINSLNQFWRDWKKMRGLNL